VCQQLNIEGGGGRLTADLADHARVEWDGEHHPGRREEDEPNFSCPFGARSLGNDEGAKATAPLDEALFFKDGVGGPNSLAGDLHLTNEVKFGRHAAANGAAIEDLLPQDLQNLLAQQWMSDSTIHVFRDCRHTRTNTPAVVPSV
jgi:hypothetical protein